MYKLIIFDADDTLFDYHQAEHYAISNAFLSQGITADEDKHVRPYREINTAIWREFEQKLITSAELRVERFRRLFHQLNLDINPEEFSSIYLSYLSTAHFLTEHAETVIHALVGKFRLCLLTNGLKDVQTSRFRLSSITKYFDAIIISEVVGYAKPDPKIFSCAFEQLGFNDKDQAIIIGDSLSSDIKGGINFGIATCWYNPQNKPLPNGIKPTYEINDLRHVLELLNIC